MRNFKQNEYRGSCMKKYTAITIGCGSVGALKPDKFDSPDTEAVLTHAHAIFNHKRIELLGCIDADGSKANLAAEKWGTEVYNKILGNPDIVVVATPTSTHKDVFGYIHENLDPRIVVGEKPLGSDIVECRHINATNDSEIAVNYIRRYEHTHQTVAAIFYHLGKSEQIYGCHVYYGRGLMHDGCHALDLMNWWFGRQVCTKITNFVVEEDFDPSYGFVAKHDRCPQVVFTPVDSKEVGMFEIEVMTSVGKYSLISNGSKLSLRQVVKGDDWGDYPSLGVESNTTSTDLTNAMTGLYDNVIDYLDGKAKLKCTGEDAVNVWKNYEQIKGTI